MHDGAGIGDAVIFEQHAPIRRQGIFDAATKQQARKRAVGVLEGAGVGIREREVKAACRHAGLAVKETAIDGDTRPHRAVGAPNEVGRFFYRLYRLTALVDTIDDAGPRRLALEAEDERAGLIIAAELAAGETSGGLRNGVGVATAQDKRVGEQAAAAMDAGKAACPSARRNRRLVTGRFQD